MRLSGLLIVSVIASWGAAAFAADPPGWQVLYREDFERGTAPGWTEDGRWTVEKDGETWAFSGEGPSLVFLRGPLWRDFRFKARVKLINGSLHLNYRKTMCGRYLVGFYPGSLSLVRMLGCYNHTNLAGVGDPHALGRWYQLEIVGRGALIQVYVNEELRLEFTDPDPVLIGSIGLEAREDSHVHLDDIEVSGPPEPEGLFWARTGGPHGGVGYDIRMRPDNPDYLMVTDNASGVSLSTDGGRTWKSSNQGIPSRTGVSGDAIPIFCLTIDPVNPNIVWAGAQNVRGIYKSTDGGRTWEQKDRGVVERNGITFRGFTVNPRDSKTVYAAAEISSTIWAGQPRMGKMFDLVKGVVYKTTDGGENWTAIWRGDNLARYIWIDPRNSNVLYVSTGIFDREAANSDPARGVPGGVGILKSTDAGRTWRALNEANGLRNLYVGSLFMHPRNPDILLAGTGHAVYDRDEGGYLSSDGGETWQRTLSKRYVVDPVSGDQITAVEFATSDPQIAYAASALAFYRSEDGGRTWSMPSGTPASPGFGPPGMQAGTPMDLQVDPRNPDRVFVNNYTGGNLLTEDGGRTWQIASQGYTGANLHDISVDPADPRRVYTSGSSGVFRSDDSGQTWIGLNYMPPNMRQWYQVWGPFGGGYAVAADPRNPGRVLFADEMSGALLLSSSYGRDWRVVFRNQQVVPQVYGQRHGFKALAFAPSDPKVAYAGMCADRNRLVNFPDQTSFGVFKSLDGGETWREANDANTARQNINVLAVDPRNENTVYAGTFTGGLLRSADGGRTWQALNRGLARKDVRALAIDPGNPQVVYAGMEDGGVAKSTDAGLNWQTASTGMDPGAAVRDIVIDPTSPQELYAADLRTGVYRSEDGGKLWIQISRGLSMRAVKALAISSDGGTLYAATEGEGVFRLDIKPRAEGAVAAVSAASFAKDAALAPESIASLFGQGLAAVTQQATAVPLPALLAEVSVSITDSAGVDRWASLFYVSPGQINCQIPAGTAVGTATLRVLRQNRVVAGGQVQIESVAPALFTANADGKGAPAAVALRIAADGSQTQLPVFHCAATCTPAPIDLGAESDQVILLLFGTGIRGGKSVSARIGGVEAPVLGAAAQGQFVGLDQVNVRLPRQLAGHGEVDLVLTVDGKAANMVKVRVQ